MAAGPIAERNQDATIYVGGLDEKVSDPILWELFLQAGPVVNVHMPKDRITQSHQGYGFVEFMGEEDADYAIKIMNMIKLYGKPIRVNKASAHQKNLDVGANLFIGNLDPEVDEKLLYDTFSAFGVILQTPKIMRDPETGNSKGFAFINFASFDASDAAMEAMNGQYLCNRAITISYAFKKDSKGERHGSAAERLLAAQNPLSHADRPHQLFADAPPSLLNPGALPIPLMPPPPPPGQPLGMPPPPLGAMRPPPMNLGPPSLPSGMSMGGPPPPRPPPPMSMAPHMPQSGVNVPTSMPMPPAPPSGMPMPPMPFMPPPPGMQMSRPPPPPFSSSMTSGGQQDSTGQMSHGGMPPGMSMPPRPPLSMGGGMQGYGGSMGPQDMQQGGGNRMAPPPPGMNMPPGSQQGPPMGHYPPPPPHWRGPPHFGPGGMPPPIGRPPKQTGPGGGMPQHPGGMRGPGSGMPPPPPPGGMPPPPPGSMLYQRGPPPQKLMGGPPPPPRGM
jgi:splicing factor 3B subunit 4